MLQSLKMTQKVVKNDEFSYQKSRNTLPFESRNVFENKDMDQNGLGTYVGINKFQKSTYVYLF